MHAPTLGQHFLPLLVFLSGTLLHFLYLLQPMIGFVQACPSRATIKPCSCNQITKGLEISCEGARVDVLRALFLGLQKNPQTVVYLKIKNSYLQNFPFDLLANIDIRHLMAHSCNMAELNESALAGLLNIQSIDFSHNQFTHIPEALKGLSSLVSLNLNYNYVQSIGERALDGLASLLRLSLFGNRITHIHPKAFVGIGPNMTLLNIGGNQLSSIPTEALNNLKSIQRIQIHENQIHTLRQQDFANLKAFDKLDTLNLAYNSLSFLEANVFSELTNLNSIDLDGNQIASIDPLAFNGITETLEWLKLGENQLNEVPTTALSNLTRLRELDLRGNHITAIHQNTFNQFGQSLRYLNLQKNKIEVIERTAFDKLPLLEWLYLNENRLRHVSENLFVKLKLEILDLHGNPLICSCEIKWYHKWIERNSHHHLASNWKGTKCTPAGDQHGDQALSLQRHFDMVPCHALILSHHLLQPWVLLTFFITSLLW